MSIVRNEISSRLHPLADRLVTLISGCPARGHRDTVWPVGALISTSAVASIAATTALYLATTAAVGLWALPLAFAGCVVFAGCVRYHQTVLMHYAAHELLFAAQHRQAAIESGQTDRQRRDSPNHRYATIASCVFVLPCPEDYYEEHVQGHHKTLRIFATGDDPDASFLRELGFIPGTPVARQKRLLLKTLLSPRFHALMAFRRIRSAARHTLARKLGVAATLSMLAIVAIMNPALGALLAFALFPVVHCAALFQFTTEHLWFSPVVRGEAANARANRLSHARFCCDPAPSTRLGWVAWWTRLLTLHLTMRVLALNGDLPLHHLHHLRPNADFQRFGALHWELYDNDTHVREYWGYGTALTAVMRHIEEAKP
jgi:Fatty acid desaturase